MPIGPTGEVLVFEISVSVVWFSKKNCLPWGRCTNLLLRSCLLSKTKGWRLLSPRGPHHRWYEPMRPLGQCPRVCTLQQAYVAFLLARHDNDDGAHHPAVSLWTIPGRWWASPPAMKIYHRHGLDQGLTVHPDQRGPVSPSSWKTPVRSNHKPTCLNTYMGHPCFCLCNTNC